MLTDKKNRSGGNSRYRKIKRRTTSNVNLLLCIICEFWLETRIKSRNIKYRGELSFVSDPDEQWYFRQTRTSPQKTYLPKKEKSTFFSYFSILFTMIFQATYRLIFSVHIINTSLRSLCVAGEWTSVAFRKKDRESFVLVSLAIVLRG